MPFDALPGSPARDLSDDELEALFSSLPTNNVLIILDTGFSSAPLPEPVRPMMTKSGGGLHETAAAAVRVTRLARCADLGEVALEVQHTGLEACPRVA